MIFLAARSVSYVSWRNMGKLADGNGNRQGRRTLNSLPVHFQQVFNMEHAKHSASRPAIQTALYPRLIIDVIEPCFEVSSIWDPPPGNVTLACVLLVDDLHRANESFRKRGRRGGPFPSVIVVATSHDVPRGTLLGTLTFRTYS
jgi:hypothetical protein